jgi:acetyl esterase/lipase
MPLCACHLSLTAALTVPSIFSNLSSDVMLKPLASRITRVPKILLRLSARHLARDNPSDPLISPLLGELSSLPPTLVLASHDEILRDDGRRYVNKAVASGSQAEFVYCMKMPHVWPIFYPDLPEAELAFPADQWFSRPPFLIVNPWACASLAPALILCKR